MSKSVGLPEWGEYLIRFANDAQLAFDDLKVRLIENGEQRFQRNFERDFQLPEEITGAITLLPQIFDGPVNTTNFDRVLEKVDEQGGRTFIEKVSGR